MYNFLNIYITVNTACIQLTTHKHTTIPSENSRQLSFLGSKSVSSNLSVPKRLKLGSRPSTTSTFTIQKVPRRQQNESMTAVRSN
jgi:hypothetical protein